MKIYYAKTILALRGKLDISQQQLSDNLRNDETFLVLNMYLMAFYSKKCYNIARYHERGNFIWLMIIQKRLKN